MTLKKRIALAGVALLVLATGTALAGVEGRWLHVRVQDHDEDGEFVAVNVPLELVGALLPTIETDEFRGGKIVIDDDDFDEIDLRAALKALRDTPDGEYVTVRSRDENVRVAKERGFFLIDAEDDGGDRVRIRMPLEVVDAMLGSGRNEIDVMAALDVLADSGNGDLITVESDDSHVRVWIDSNQVGD
jgi:hypothetical protein